MASRQSPGSIMQALNELNILAASAMGAFFLVSLVMVGLASPIIGWFESVTLLPLTVSLLLMAIAFLSSGSRSTGDYHWFEKAYVLFIMFLMILFAWAPFKDLVMSYSPFGSILALGLMCVATAILAR